MPGGTGGASQARIAEFKNASVAAEGDQTKLAFLVRAILLDVITFSHGLLDYGLGERAPLTRDTVAHIQNVANLAFDVTRQLG